MFCWRIATRPGAIGARVAVTLPTVAESRARRCPLPSSELPISKVQGSEAGMIHTTSTAELTPRAILAGCLLGAVLAAANVYTDLKTASIDGGNITASVLAFAAFRGARRPYTQLENNLTQTIAASAAVMSMVVGVAGPMAALALLGHTYAGWALGLWGLSLGVLGVLIAVILRQRLIVLENLPFPTGTATSEVITAMANGASRAASRARALALAALFAAAVTWFRDGPGAWIPAQVLVPGSIAGISTTVLSLGVSVSPLMFSTGLLIGLRAGASMLLGSTVAWACLAPLIVRFGIVADAEYGTLVNWLMWPGAALILASSLTSLALQWRSLVRGLRDLTVLTRDPSPAGEPAVGASSLRALLVLGLFAIVLLLALASYVFDLGIGSTLSALALSFVLAGVCARSAGETDIAPIGSMGGVTQIAFGSSSRVSSLAYGSIASGTAAQAASTLWAFKAGQRLGASAKAQVLGQLLGAVVGAVVVIPTYAVIVRAYGLGTAKMPAPGALSWKATAEAVQGGLAALPSHAPTAALVALLLGCGLTLLSETRAGRFLPSPVALGIAFLLPMSISASMFVGALLLTLLMRRFPRWTDEHISSIAGGAIAGESLFGVILAALIATGWLAG